MWKRFVRILLGIGGIWSIARWVLDYWGYLETGRSLFAGRNDLIRTLGTAVTSQWFPIAVFLAAVIALGYIEWWLPRQKHIKNDSTRPRFHVEDSGVIATPTGIKIRIWIVNRGATSARDLHITLEMLNKDLRGETLMIRDSVGHELHPQSESTVFFSIRATREELCPKLFSLNLSYVSSESNISYDDRTFWKWDGFVSGKPEPRLAFASISERDALERYFAESKASSKRRLLGGDLVSNG